MLGGLGGAFLGLERAFGEFGGGVEVPNVAESSYHRFGGNLLRIVVAWGSEM